MPKTHRTLYTSVSTELLDRFETAREDTPRSTYLRYALEFFLAHKEAGEKMPPIMQHKHPSKGNTAKQKANLIPGPHKSKNPKKSGAEQRAAAEARLMRAQAKEIELRNKAKAAK